MGRCRQSKAGRGNCRTMQTVEKQLVLEENWQVLAVVFPPFAQRLENSVSRACWPGSMSLGVFHSSHGLCYCSRLYGQANGGADLGSGRCQPRPHLPIYRMTQKKLLAGSGRDETKGEPTSRRRGEGSLGIILSQAAGGDSSRSVTTRASLTLESVEVSVFPL